MTVAVHCHVCLVFQWMCSIMVKLLITAVKCFGPLGCTGYQKLCKYGQKENCKKSSIAGVLLSEDLRVDI